MVVEIVTVLSILAGGVILIRTTGISGFFLPGVGFVMGVCLYILIGTVQALTPLPTSPNITLGLTLTLPLIWWAYSSDRGKDVSITPLPAALFLAYVVIAIAIFRELKLVSVTVDSFYYLTIGSLLEGNNLDHASPFLLLTRLLAVPLLHAPANMSGEFYLRSVTPILAISSLNCLAWLVYEDLRVKVINLNMAKLFSAGAVLLLLTNNRFAHNAFYINGHLLTAVLLLLLVGCGWLIVQKSELSSQALIGIQLITIPVLIVTRPENSFFVVIALVPFLTSDQVDRGKRILILATIGISIIAWHGFLWINYLGAGENVPQAVIGMLVFGIGMLLVIPLLTWIKVDHVLAKSNILVESSLWLILLAFAYRDPGPLSRSIDATYKNIMLDYGGWGISVLVIGFIALGILLFTQAKNRLFLRFPLTAFLPFSFLLVYLREGAYRVGFGDSLNRMILHIVPLAILFIVSAAGSQRWGFSERTVYYWKLLLNAVKKRFMHLKRLGGIQ
jgi:hypothetical protein